MDPSDFSSEDEEESEDIRQWELNKIRGGGALSDSRTINAVNCISKEGDTKIPTMPFLNFKDVEFSKVEIKNYLKLQNEKQKEIPGFESQLKKIEMEIKEAENELMILNHELEYIHYCKKYLSNKNVSLDYFHSKISEVAPSLFGNINQRIQYPFSKFNKNED